MSAVGIVAELGYLRRFESPRQLMSYAGLVPSENSSGAKARRGGITKAGNRHVRWLPVKSAWSYRMKARKSAHLLKGKDKKPSSVRYWQTYLQKRRKAQPRSGKTSQTAWAGSGRRPIRDRGTSATNTLSCGTQPAHNRVINRRPSASALVSSSRPWSINRLFRKSSRSVPTSADAVGGDKHTLHRLLREADAAMRELNCCPL